MKLKNKVMILCPYCLTKVQPTKENSSYKCSNVICKRSLPRDLVEMDISKSTVGLVGFTGHGKTAYLTSLFYLLKFLSRRRVWGEDFSWLSLDDNTHRIMYKHVPSFENSQLPPGTPENFPEPALIKFNNIPLAKHYLISFYDTAGRVYEESYKITNMGKFVANSEVVLFIISINDCMSPGPLADKMEELLNIYIIAVYDKLNLNLKENQHLIVVLTKADSIKGLSKEMSNFIIQGSYKWYSINNSNNAKEDFRYKIKELKKWSKTVKSWLEDNDCGGFTRLAQHSFKSVEYTMISSLGAAPEGFQLATKLEPEHPKRVLDPFLWIIEKTRTKGFFEKIFE